MPWESPPSPEDEERKNIIREFRKKARFLVDETLGTPVANVLRNRNWNSKSVQEVGLAGHDDDDVFAYSWRNKRFIVTQDRDFLDGRRFPFNRCYGVFILPGEPSDSDEFVQAFHTLVALFAPFSNGFVGSKILFHRGGEFDVYNTDGIRTRYKVEETGDVSMWVDDN